MFKLTISNAKLLNRADLRRRSWTRAQIAALGPPDVVRNRGASGKVPLWFEQRAVAIEAQYAAFASGPSFPAP